MFFVEVLIIAKDNMNAISDKNCVCLDVKFILIRAVLVDLYSKLKRLKLFCNGHMRNTGDSY